MEVGKMRSNKKCNGYIVSPTPVHVRLDDSWIYPAVSLSRNLRGSRWRKVAIGKSLKTENHSIHYVQLQTLTDTSNL